MNDEHYFDLKFVILWAGSLDSFESEWKPLREEAKERNRGVQLAGLRHSPCAVDDIHHKTHFDLRQILVHIPTRHFPLDYVSKIWKSCHHPTKWTNNGKPRRTKMRPHTVAHWIELDKNVINMRCAAVMQNLIEDSFVAPKAFTQKWYSGRLVPNRWHIVQRLSWLCVLFWI